MEDLKYLLGEYRRQINEKYASFVSRLCTAVMGTQVSLEDFRLYVLSLSAFQDQDGVQPNLLDDIRKDKIEKADTIQRVFQVLSTDCCSFLCIDIFQSIMKHYNIVDDSEDLKYTEHLLEYIEKHKISEFLEINPRLEAFSGIPNHKSKKLTLKFDVKLSSKVTKVYNLKVAIARILKLIPSALQLIGIEEGCVIITYLISEFIADYIMKNITEEQISDIQNLSVLWMKC